MDSDFYIYDQVMIGRKATLGKELYESTINGKKEYSPVDEACAIKIIKYAFEYYLGWSPEEVFAKIDKHIICEMHLDGMVNQRIKFPVELEPMENLEYLVHLMYPERYNYDGRRAIEAYYDRVLAGEIKRFKKGFFTEEYGSYRARVCFQRMIQLAGQFSNIRQMYDYFSGTEGRQMLTKYKLSSAARDLYEFPLDFLHYSLPQKDRDDMYYYKLRFEIVNEKQKRAMKKEHSFVG